MADLLKNMYNPAFFEKLCPVMRATIPGFDCRDFIFRVFNNQWPDLELKQRVRHISHVLHHFLPGNFAEASKILTKLSTQLRETMPEQNFICMFIPDYIEVYGIAHPDESLEAIEEITKLVSAEFAIRPFIIQHEEKTMRKMAAWSKHENAGVRRLSSEGCRPRLPWGMGLPAFKKNPSAILPILENLKNDPTEYVRRSVANNLNDIAKDHPKIVLAIAKAWLSGSVETQWIIKHGCRTLLKKGDVKILKLHGFNPKVKSAVTNFALEKKKIKLGDTLKFGFDFINTEKKISQFRLEYAIDYQTRSGKSSRKIFKIAEGKYEAGKINKVTRKQSFKDLTTRKHFKGGHTLSIMVNGTTAGTAKFLVI